MTREDVKEIILEVLNDQTEEPYPALAEYWEEAKRREIIVEGKPKAIPSREQVVLMLMKAFNLSA